MLISDWSSDVCSSCLDLALETKLDVQVRDWLSFAVQKLEELSILRLGLADGRYVISDELAANADSITSSCTSSLTNDRQVRAQTGRAACRERVGQYVMISVVDDSLKKKENNTT